MLAQLNPVELWTLRINPSDLYNIERAWGDNPLGGGGHTYIQVPEILVPSLLKFLKAPMPPLGTMIPLQVHNPAAPNAAPQPLEFWPKSQGRMRIARQNRHRPPHFRPTPWSPAAGFPTLPAGQKTANARALLNGLGHVHVYLARDANGVVWAGFTQGSPTAAERMLPFANIAWGPGRGSYWP